LKFSVDIEASGLLSAWKKITGYSDDIDELYDMDGQNCLIELLQIPYFGLAERKNQVE
jgi:hypothetical protein